MAFMTKFHGLFFLIIPSMITMIIITINHNGFSEEGTIVSIL